MYKIDNGEGEGVQKSLSMSDPIFFFLMKYFSGIKHSFLHKNIVNNRSKEYV